MILGISSPKALFNMEFFVSDMKNLPNVVEKRLSELRQLDSESVAIAKSTAAEETQIFEELSQLAKTDPDFDEEPIKKRFEALISRRQEAQASVDEQMKKIQRLYDLVDGRITYIGETWLSFLLSVTQN